MQARIIKLEAAHAGTVRFLSGLHVTLEEGKATSWVTVTRTGTFTDPRYGKFDISRKMLQQIVDNFAANAYGQDIFFDVAHKPENGAAGKVLKLSVEGDRLRALVEWTPYGLDANRNKGFKYSSIEYHENFVDNETGKAWGPVMLGAALVTRPCVKRSDPIQLSESGEGDVPVLLHPELQSTLLQEITVMHKHLIAALAAAFGTMALNEATAKQLTEAFEKSVANVTDENTAKQLKESFEATGKQLSEQLGNKPAVVQLSIPSTGLNADDVKNLLHEEAARVHKEQKQLAEKSAANVKLLADTIGAASGLDEATKKTLSDEVADLVTAEMSESQIKRLAEVQINKGNQIAAARQLSGMGYQFPAGDVRITVDSSNQIKALQENADKRLGILQLSDARRFSNTNGQLQTLNKEFADRVLALYDAEHGAQLHAEHKLLAAGDSKVSDVAIPAIFERTVIREALYNLIGLQFVDTGTLPFSASALIPYSYRDTTAAGISNARVYEGGSIPRAGVKQTSETVYPIPQKIAFEVSDELRYLTGNGQLNWDAVAENQRNATRIIGEDLERLIFNEILDASDQFAVTTVTNEAVGTGNGSKSIWPVAQFPVVRPKKVYDLQGTQVGSTVNPITITVNAVGINEYDFTGTQSANTYWWMDYNLGEIHFVNQVGTPVNITNTHAIVCTYGYTTNAYKFDTDLGSVTLGDKYDDFLYRYGLRKSVVEDQRYYMANFGLMSGTVRTQVEQAKSFVESFMRNGTALDATGNLGTVKGVPNYKTSAPGLVMGDSRVLLGERGTTRFRMMKPWTMNALENQKDSNGRFTGKKEAYGDQFVVVMTPTQLKGAYTSIALYSTAARISR